MTGKDLVRARPSNLEEMVADLQTMAGLDIENASDIGNKLVAKILTGDTLDDIFAVNGLEAGKNWLDKPITVVGVGWNESHFEESFGFYAVMDCIDESTGEEKVIGTSARQSCAQLYAVQRVGLFPIRVMIRQAATPSKAGFRAQWLELIRD